MTDKEKQIFKRVNRITVLSGFAIFAEYFISLILRMSAVLFFTFILIFVTESRLKSSIILIAAGYIISLLLIPLFDKLISITLDAEHRAIYKDTDYCEYELSNLKKQCNYLMKYNPEFAEQHKDELNKYIKDGIFDPYGPGTEKTPYQEFCEKCSDESKRSDYRKFCGITEFTDKIAVWLIISVFLSIFLSMVVISADLELFIAYAVSLVISLAIFFGYNYIKAKKKEKLTN
ncbi:MAG: hypothetical protein IKO47_12485 [Ruminococcus sp.]|nr:hypothetical protein [Ruminococcus sp.]